MQYRASNYRDPARSIARLLNTQAGGPVFAPDDIRELMERDWYKLSNLAHALHNQLKDKQGDEKSWQIALET